MQGHQHFLSPRKSSEPRSSLAIGFASTERASDCIVSLAVSPQAFRFHSITAPRFLTLLAFFSVAANRIALFAS
jgi:hypothetical protein